MQFNGETNPPITTNVSRTGVSIPNIDDIIRETFDFDAAPPTIPPAVSEPIQSLSYNGSHARDNYPLYTNSLPSRNNENMIQQHQLLEETHFGKEVETGIPSLPSTPLYQNASKNTSTFRLKQTHSSIGNIEPSQSAASLLASVGLEPSMYNNDKKQDITHCSQHYSIQTNELTKEIKNPLLLTHEQFAQNAMPSNNINNSNQIKFQTQSNENPSVQKIPDDTNLIERSYSSKEMVDKQHQPSFPSHINNPPTHIDPNTKTLKESSSIIKTDQNQIITNQHLSDTDSNHVSSLQPINAIVDAIDRLNVTLKSSFGQIEDLLEQLVSRTDRLEEKLRYNTTDIQTHAVINQTNGVHTPVVNASTTPILSQNQSSYGSRDISTVIQPSLSETPSKPVNRGALINPPIPLSRRQRYNDQSASRRTGQLGMQGSNPFDKSPDQTIPPVLSSEEARRIRQEEEARRIAAERQQILEEQRRRQQLEQRARSVMDSILTESTNAGKKSTLFDEEETLSTGNDIGGGRNPLFY